MLTYANEWGVARLRRIKHKSPHISWSAGQSPLSSITLQQEMMWSQWCHSNYTLTALLPHSPIKLDKISTMTWQHAVPLQSFFFLFTLSPFSPFGPTDPPGPLSPCHGSSKIIQLHFLFRNEASDRITVGSHCCMFWVSRQWNELISLEFISEKKLFLFPWQCKSHLHTSSWSDNHIVATQCIQGR